MGNTLVVYYSHSGNTRAVAELIARETGGSIWEILPQTNYPTSYNAVVKQAKQEIQAGHLPEINGTFSGLDACDTVFVGTPNWWSTIAPPVATFLSNNDLAGKTVVPFCTHGGGGGGRIEAEVAKLCPASILRQGIIISGNGGAGLEKTIKSWLADVL